MEQISNIPDEERARMAETPATLLLNKWLQAEEGKRRLESVNDYLVQEAVKLSLSLEKSEQQRLVLVGVLPILIAQGARKLYLEGIRERAAARILAREEAREQSPGRVVGRFMQRVFDRFGSFAARVMEPYASEVSAPVSKTQTYK